MALGAATRRSRGPPHGRSIGPPRVSSRAPALSTRAPTPARATLRPLYFDVVAFEGASQTLRLGVVTSALDDNAESGAGGPAAMQSSPSSSSPSAKTITVAPLRPSPCWAESGLWVEDEDQGANKAVPLSAVRAVLTGASLEQRQDTGPSNPHGEHAHDVWVLPRVIVEEEELDAGVRRRIDALLAGGGKEDG